ncbi:MAG TPA: rubrerythrin family protein [Candidatus Merdenecus merdavium]|nr:rubrerythrin family protein [Candidatus Merdenecus merdavium]
MAIDFKKSETKNNLMRAFAGESQARNRYAFAASQAKKQGVHVIERVFTFTGNQEREHAEIFYEHLRNLAGETIVVDGGYPIDLYDDILDVLKAARHNEFEEHDPIYKDFAQIAREEGFPDIAASFHMIAQIEKVHGERFGMFADLLEKKQLFESEEEQPWMCLNCGHIHYGKQVPDSCPVCDHNQGYFIRWDMAPYSK